MKKIIIAAAILVTTAIVALNVKSVNTTKTAVSIEKDILATAD